MNDKIKPIEGDSIHMAMTGLHQLKHSQEGLKEVLKCILLSVYGNQQHELFEELQNEIKLKIGMVQND